VLEKLSVKEIEIVKMIREKVPKVTIKSHSIPFWRPDLWKYRKSQVPAIGIKLAIEIVLMVKKELENMND